MYRGVFPAYFMFVLDLDFAFEDLDSGVQHRRES